MRLKTLTLTIALVALTLGAQSCKTSKSMPTTQLEGQWVLKSLNGQDAKSVFTKMPTIEFDLKENKVSGAGGCNRYFGQFTLAKDIFNAPQLGSTMMMCTDANQEPQFLQALSKTSKLSVNNNELTLTQNGKAVIVFSKAKPLGESDLAGTWKLQSIQGSSANTLFEERVPTVEFDFKEMRANGNAGCNRYNAQFKLDKNMIELSQPRATKMACPSLKGESKFIELITGASKISVEDGLLTLSRDGLTLLQFTK